MALYDPGMDTEPQVIPQEHGKLAAPTPIRPNFARERANIVWKGYQKVALEIEKRAQKQTTAGLRLRAGRLLGAGEAKVAYQANMLGVKQPDKVRKPAQKVSPRHFTRKTLGSERYRNYIGAKKGDPY